MTKLADIRTSGNPVFPYEWEVHYIGGHIVHRVDGNVRRVCALLPTVGVVRMRINGPGLARLDIVPQPGIPIEQLIARTGVRHIGGNEGLVTGWRFGFKQDDRFVGALIDTRGTARLVSRPWGG